MLVKTCVNCTVQNNKITMLTISARCAENEFIEKGIAIRLRGVNYCSSNLRKSCMAGGGLQSTSQRDRIASCGWIVSPQFGPISAQRKWIFSDLLCLETNFCFDNQTERYS